MCHSIIDLSTTPGEGPHQIAHRDTALGTIIRAHGGMPDEAAHDYRRELVADKCYVRDVY